MISLSHFGLRTGLLPKQQRRSTEARAAILTAAALIFARLGLDGARMDAIASAAGVNKAMLYYYFQSKDLLYSAVLESHFKDFQERAMAALRAEGSARSTLLRFVESHFDFLATQPDYSMLFQRLMLTGAVRTEGLVRKYYAPVARELVRVLDRGQRDGEFRRFDSHHMAISVVAINVFYFAMARMVRIASGIDVYSRASRKRRKAEVLQLIRHGLFRNPQDPVS
jgi:TetR/AcrR family transcriptional regulator